MATKRITSITTITPTATADTVNLVDATYPFLLRGGSSTQINRVLEIYFGGQAVSASSPTFMIVAADSTVGTGSNSNGTGQNDAPLNAMTAALAAPALTGNSNATTKPQRSSSLHLHNLSFNAYGGITKWSAADSGPIEIAGASANTGELSVSAFTGGTTGAIGGYMVYETE